MTTTAFRMNELEDNAKRFALSSSSFIRKAVLCFSRFRGWEFPDHQARELTPDKCFNLPLELFLQVLDGRFRRFALMRVSFASKGVLMRTQCTIWNTLLHLGNP
jgi:hypothetical protein